MTNNKFEGQTLNRVDLHLEEPVFAHGQLYTALSHVSHLDNIHIMIPSRICEEDLEHSL